jgi:hypothetical protein
VIGPKQARGFTAGVWPTVESSPCGPGDGHSRARARGGHCAPAMAARLPVGSPTEFSLQDLCGAHENDVMVVLGAVTGTKLIRNWASTVRRPRAVMFQWRWWFQGSLL